MCIRMVQVGTPILTLSLGKQPRILITNKYVKISDLISISRIRRVCIFEIHFPLGNTDTGNDKESVFT